MKHPHAEMIIEWANDTSKQPQVRDIDNGGHYDCRMQDVFIGNERGEFRFKPREFNEGEWYPCVDKDGDESIKMFTGDRFCTYINGDLPHHTYRIDNLKWIGESLGKLKFG